MIAGLPLGFAQPLVLLGLLSLPVLWWLLRLVPPRPRRIEFPPTRLLLEIAPQEETPARTPWWLTLIRLALAALVFGALVIGTTPILVRLAACGPAAAGFWRLAFATPLLALMASRRGAASIGRPSIAMVLAGVWLFGRKAKTKMPEVDVEP